MTYWLVRERFITKSGALRSRDLGIVYAKGSGQAQMITRRQIKYGEMPPINSNSSIEAIKADDETLEAFQAFLKKARAENILAQEKNKRRLSTKEHLLKIFNRQIRQQRRR